MTKEQIAAAARIEEERLRCVAANLEQLSQHELAVEIQTAVEQLQRLRRMLEAK